MMAFELDKVIVAFELGNLRFDDQIEIEGTTLREAVGGVPVRMEVVGSIRKT